MSFKKIKEPRKVSYDELDLLIQKDIAGGPDKVMSKLPEPDGWDQTDSMLIECEGYWKLFSNSNPKWKASGKAIVGGKTMCREARSALADLQRRYGIARQPWDMSYQFEPLNLKKFRLVGEKKPL